MFASTIEIKQVNFMRRFRGMSYDDIVEAIEACVGKPVNNWLIWIHADACQAFQDEINELLEDLYDDE